MLVSTNKIRFVKKATVRGSEEMNAEFLFYEWERFQWKFGSTFIRHLSALWRTKFNVVA